MSLAIDPSHVTAILLADGWHELVDSSMWLDAYEYVDEDDDTVRGILFGGGRSDLICATGFKAVERGMGSIAGPLNSIIAVRTND